MLQKDNLAIVCSWDTANVNGILGYTKEIKSRPKEGGRLVTLPEIKPWPVGDRVGIGVAIQILEKSLCTGRTRRNYLQFNTVGKLQEAV